MDSNFRSTPTATAAKAKAEAIAMSEKSLENTNKCQNSSVQFGMCLFLRKVWYTPVKYATLHKKLSTFCLESFRCFFVIFFLSCFY